MTEVMKANYPEEEYIDLRKIFRLLREKWWYFAISLVICLGIAFLYLKMAPKMYEVQATLQLKDQSLSDKGVGQEKFINGLELLSGNSQLADEIGILSSYAMVERALEQLDFRVSYYQYPDAWGPLGKRMEEELYQPGFRILPHYERPQLVGVPIHINFPQTGYYRILVEADEARLYDFREQKTVQEKIAVAIDSILPLDQAYTSPLFSFQLRLDSNYVVSPEQPHYVVLNTIEKLTEDYAQKLSIEPISDESNIVTIKTEGRVPQKEKDFLNTLASVYIQHDLHKKNQLGLRAIEFIDSQLTTVYDSLQSVEGNLESFRASNQIIDVSTTSENLNDQLQALEAEQAQLEVQQRYYQYTSEYLRNNENVTDVVAPSSVGIDDPLLNNLLQDLAAMSQEKVAKAYSSGENNPVLRILEGKIRNTKAALIENIDNLISSNRIALQENQRRVNKLEVELNRLPESERNLITIERKFALNDNIYNYLLEKRAEAGIAIASNLPDKSIVDVARGGKESNSPDRLVVLLFALAASLGMPIGLIFVQEFMNDKVREKKEIEELTELPVIGTINSLGRQNDKYTIGKPYQVSPIEDFKFIAINLNHFYNLKENKIIGISSAQAGDGKTLCSAYLAETLARSGKRTLLVDADLRRPGLHRFFDTKGGGLSDYLHEEDNYWRFLHRTNVDKLYFMPSGQRFIKDPTFLLSGGKIEKMLADLRNEFNTIIFDTPPMNPVSDFFALAGFFDITLIVVRHNKTNRYLLEEITEKIKRNKLDNVSLVLNDVKSLDNYKYTKQYSGKRSMVH